MITYPRSSAYANLWKGKIMGPNPVKLTEELMRSVPILPGSNVLDLGSGMGITSVFLAKEYGLTVTAGDLWSNPEDNQKFFASCNLSETRIKAVKADATALPFEPESFDAIFCIDSYNYFGRDKTYLNRCLLPFVKHGGYIAVVITGMTQDMHDNLPAELLAAWTPEQLEYIHDVTYWRDILTAADGLAESRVFVMESHEEVWNDWLAESNEYAANDRKAFEAGGGKYLNFVAGILKKA